MAAQWGFTEDATDPMVAPQDYDVRQSGRVLELQSSDLWLRPTDLSWHFPVLMTIREEPFKDYRSRTSEKWKAKFEEAKKQKVKKTMMDGVMPTGKHHLSHGTNLHLGNNGVRTKRVSALIGKPQLIGAAQIQRVNVPNGDHRVPGSHHSHGSEE